MTTVNGAFVLLYFGSFLAPPLLGVVGAALDRDRWFQYLAAGTFGFAVTKLYFSVPISEATAFGLLVSPGAVFLVPAGHTALLERRSNGRAGRVLLVYSPPLLLEAVTVVRYLSG